MRYLIMIILLSLVSLSCQEEQSDYHPQNQDDQTGNNTYRSIRFLALGDSYTIGESVDESQRWPLQLADVLSFKDNYTSKVGIIARTGWTTGQLAQAIETEQPEGPYDLVSLLIGVNNQYQGLDSADYRVEFVSLLQTAIELAGGKERVMVVSIPDYSVMPFAIKLDNAKVTREIEAYNRINLQETVKAVISCLV